MMIGVFGLIFTGISLFVAYHLTNATGDMLDKRDIEVPIFLFWAVVFNGWWIASFLTLCAALDYFMNAIT